MQLHEPLPTSPAAPAIVLAKPNAKDIHAPPGLGGCGADASVVHPSGLLVMAAR